MGNDRGENEINFTPARVLPAPSNPMAVARELLDEWTTEGGLLALRHWRGGWLEWQTTHWAEVEDREIRAQLYGQVEHAVYATDKEPKLWEPTRRKIADLMEAQAAITHLPMSVDAPAWIDGDDLGGPIVAVTNGLLHVPTRKLLDHTPRFLNLVSVPFDFDPPRRRRHGGFGSWTTCGAAATTTASARCRSSSATPCPARRRSTRFCSSSARPDRGRARWLGSSRA